MITQNLTKLREMVLSSPTLEVATTLKNKILGLIDSEMITEKDEMMLQSIFEKEATQMQALENQYNQETYENNQKFIEEGKPLLAQAKKEIRDQEINHSNQEDKKEAENILNDM